MSNLNIEFLSGLVADHKREIRDGSEYDKYFPKVDMKNSSLKRNGTVSNTVQFMGDIVHSTLNDTKKIADVLYALNGKILDNKQTCENIWNFCYHYMQYELDAPGKEQLRRPARAWKDGNKGDGVDCDCFSIFCSSILTNLHIPHYLRIADYGNGWQHVYVIVPKHTNANLEYGSGEYITIDPVLNHFDEEKEPSKKSNFDMTNHKLSGIPIEYLSGDTYDNDIRDIINGVHFEQILSGPDDGIDAQQLLDAILNHIVSTRDAIVKNPNSVITQGGAQYWTTMLNHAIDSWHNPVEREKALDTLEKEEARWNLTLKGYDDNEEHFGAIGFGLGKIKFFQNITAVVQHAATAIKKAGHDAAASIKATGVKIAAGAEHFVKQTISAIKRYNPISLAARGGYLLALKINLFGISTKLSKNATAYEKVRKMFVDTLGGKEDKLKAAIQTGASKKQLGRTEDDLGLAACCSVLGGPEIAIIPAIIPIIETINALKGVDGLGDDELPKDTDKAEIIKKIVEWIKGMVSKKKLSPTDLDPAAAAKLANESASDEIKNKEKEPADDSGAKEGVFAKIGSFHKQHPVMAYSIDAALLGALFFGGRAIVKGIKNKKAKQKTLGTTKQYRKGKRIADKFLPPGSRVKAITYNGIGKRKK